MVAERRRWAVGLLASATTAATGYRTGSLTATGALAAVAVGTTITGRAGYSPAAVVVAFFSGSSLLSRLGSARRRDHSWVVTKGERRDVRQVAANGLVATLVAARSPQSNRAMLAFLCAVAAVTGDTWSTEIGSLSRNLPRHILTGRPVSPGTSGGVTELGLGGAVAGGAFIGIVAAATRPVDHAVTAFPPVRLLGTTVIAGLLGSLVDSLLGATLQERRRCPTCHEPTERKCCQCGSPTLVTGGIAGVDNDAVNFLTSVAGAVIGWVLAPRRT
jgi:uncharacterized protein (TIGR00297 family)